MMKNANKRMVFMLACLVFAFSFSGTLWALDDTESVWKEAGESYLKDNFDDAAQKWQSLVDLGYGGADLHYNLGCAYQQSGRLGYAILNYEKALGFDSDCTDCRENLRLANRVQLDQVVKNEGEAEDTRGVLERVVQDGHVNTFTFIFLPLFLALWLVVILRRFAKGESRRFALNLVATILLVSVLVSGGLLTWKVYGFEKHSYAVLLQHEVEIKEGPNANFKTLFSIHEGLKLRLGEEVEDWTQVWLENGLNGYVPKSYLGNI